MKQFYRKDRIELFIEKETEAIFDEFVEYNKTVGVRTDEIAKKLELTRSNVSKELNSLFRERKVIKITGKPVLYLSVKPLRSHLDKVTKTDYLFNSEEIIALLNQEKTVTEKKSVFSTMIGAEGSLRTLIEQLTAAILYPPNGLNILLTGSTGVGKTTMVNYLYQYAIEEAILTPQDPLVSFNCADYADNPQLLMSLLFGYEKGAFTGANSQQEGLVKQAENGILFLDEVHRLPPQAQEMLFQVIDNQTYRRLGQVETNSLKKILFVMATTEDISSFLLKTFTRRVPVIVTLPDLEKRYPAEKLDYIHLFLNEEAQRIHSTLFVTKEAIEALLTYKTEGNLGQLKVDIKLACAKAYMKNRKNRLQPLTLNFNDFPESVIKSYFEERKNQDVLTKDLITRLDKMTKFDGTLANSFHFNNEEKNLALPIISTLASSSTQDTTELTQLYKEAKGFYHQVNTLEELNQSQSITKIVDYSTFLAIQTTLSELQLNLEKNTVLGLILHINTLKEKVFSKKMPKYSKDTSIKENYAQEYQMAILIRKRLNQLLDFYIPEGELTFLTMLLHLSKEKKQNSIGVLALSHGNVASSMCKVVNSFLNTDHAVAIDLPLDEDIDQLYDKVAASIEKLDQGRGVLILSDMGSLTLFAKVMQEKMPHQIMSLSPINTPMLLEATRKSLLSTIDLNELATSLKKTFLSFEEDFNDSFLEDYQMVESLQQCLLFIDPKKTIAVLDTVLNAILTEKNYVTENESLRIKFIFHCSSMIERILLNDFLPYNSIEEFKQTYEELFRLVKRECEEIQNNFFITIPDTELAYLVEIFDTHFSVNKSF